LKAAGVDMESIFGGKPDGELINELAVEYARLFIGPGHHIAPYATLYFGDMGASLWGPVTSWVKGFIEEAGFDYKPDFHDLPDHVSVELEFMQEITSRLAQARENGNDDGVLELADLSRVDRQILAERRLLTPETERLETGTGVVVSADEAVSVLINEEDHLRVQGLAPGLRPLELWQRLDKLDNKVAERLPLAYDSQLGFLTACPTNVGTGLRVSVMLQLPALVLTGHVEAVGRACNAIGLSVRGTFGEGTDFAGNLYQISNQYTLGTSEDMIVRGLHDTISAIIEQEQNARAALLSSDRTVLYQHVGAAYGVLRYSYRLNSADALAHLAALRLGVHLGMITGLTQDAVQDLMVRTQPGHLQYDAGEELDSAARDIRRASLIRDRLADSAAQSSL